MVETTPVGQTFYEAEAEVFFPEGCKCPYGRDADGSCDWCQVYYNGPSHLVEHRLTHPFIYCRNCESVQPYFFGVGVEPHDLVCQTCATIAVCFHEHIPATKALQPKEEGK